MQADDSQIGRCNAARSRCAGASGKSWHETFTPVAQDRMPAIRPINEEWMASNAAKHWAPLLHKCPPSLDVVFAFETGFHQRVACVQIASVAAEQLAYRML